MLPCCAHTHLDLGGLRGKLSPPSDFTEWLRAVVAYRRTNSPAEWQDSIRGGIRESLASGTTLVGDISSGGLSLALLTAAPLRSVVFLELIGLKSDRARQCAKEAAEWLRQSPGTDRCRLGLSPHAPYSVRRSLFRLVARRLANPAVPVAIHLGETKLEEELLKSHTGPLRAFLEELNAWDETGLIPKLSWPMFEFEHHRPVLYIHANYLPPSFWLRFSNASYVYCPRTHSFFSHVPHLYREMLSAGKMTDREINVALGTDSLASNPDLSILEEMQFLWRRDHANLAGDVLLRMGTLNGAIALGWSDETGSLTPGKSADWITIPLANTDGDDPYRLLFEGTNAVRDVVIRGEWVLRDYEHVAPAN
jgi:aminodeoxyfutalosine deaminase